MEKVTAYKLSSGELILDKEDAEKAENDFIFRNAISSFCDRYGWSGMTTTDMADIIEDYAEDLKRILNGTRTA